MHLYPSTIERRITLRLLAYWEKLRKDRLMPTEAEVNSDDIWDLWGSCFLVRAVDLAKPDCSYTHIGQSILDAYRHGIPEDDAAGMISPDASRIADSCIKVIETSKPLLEEGEFSNPHGDIIKYRQCLLPLGDGRKVKAVFGGMNFKLFPAKVSI